MFKEIDIVYLKQKVQEYLETIPNSYKDETWCTPRSLADVEISGFIEGLEDNV